MASSSGISEGLRLVSQKPRIWAPSHPSSSEYCQVWVLLPWALRGMQRKQRCWNSRHLFLPLYGWGLIFLIYKKNSVSCISPASQVLQNLIGKCLKEVLQDSEVKRRKCTFLPAVIPCSRTFPTGLYGWLQKWVRLSTQLLGVNPECSLSLGFLEKDEYIS